MAGARGRARKREYRKHAQQTGCERTTARADAVQQAKERKCVVFFFFTTRKQLTKTGGPDPRQNPKSQSSGATPERRREQRPLVVDVVKVVGVADRVDVDHGGVVVVVLLL
eukprot:CAMPEP_0185711828 /NCGR_PEP_ID=MMETSP1164-20130828/33579_1 /TAXON_ID=1104430 /ORGANISM="Chrysoreinhardia sp, Strain CCMP2950" /LENGTH=110 /DNA_ID=CAMNT_0028379371 /DNA_START=35 /DNA_END=364 /DNA_ORIENTATION=+